MEDQDQRERQNTEEPRISPGEQEIALSGMHVRTAIPTALLATARVRLVGPRGVGVTVRALLDQGSQSSFVHRDLLHHLNIPVHKVNAQIYGINDTKGEHVKQMVSCSVASLTESGWTIPIRALVVGRMTGILPSRDLRIPVPSSWKTLPLADPQFETSGRVDVILGADVYGSEGEVGPHRVYNIRVNYEENLDNVLRRFWEVEEVPLRPAKSDADEFYEELYKTKEVLQVSVPPSVVTLAIAIIARLLLLLLFCVVMKSNREFENRAAIIVALRAGRSPKEIVDFLKLPKTTIYRVKKQFDEADSNKEGIATRKKHSRRSDRVRGEEFVKNVKEKIDGNPGKSMRAIAKEMDVGSMTIVRTIHEDLGLKSYALRKGFFSDEKNFDVDQKVNPRNDRWICKDPSEIPVVMHTKFPASVMVLGVISSEGDVMPPHFFEKGLRMNADTYINVLETVVKPWMDMVAAGRKYVFQQDSAPAHKAKKTQSWLTLNVPSHWGPDIWPPNSPDCNPLDYYVWGVVERDVNKAPHTTIQSVKKAVHTVMTQMDKVIVAKACASFRTRLETVLRWQDLEDDLKDKEELINALKVHLAFANGLLDKLDQLADEDPGRAVPLDIQNPVKKCLLVPRPRGIRVLMDYTQGYRRPNGPPNPGFAFVYPTRGTTPPRFCSSYRLRWQDLEDDLRDKEELIKALKDHIEQEALVQEALVLAVWEAEARSEMGQQWGQVVRLARGWWTAEHALGSCLCDDLGF
ncbi:hypothetical protein LAZ67_3006267 [Cordylochernes scorpioides]|uniref:Transposase n=1 Tax=Cordylochernes scorpioides TaxID=51811 RepID=A0ABY6KB21_9ARAC|nr:hypothetical protein LAZ67_3006267 [Cordylochernes scorpioides]